MEGEDLRLVTGHVAGLMEHFDTVQIICTRECNDGTRRVDQGFGNYYARVASLEEWLTECEEASRVRARNDNRPD